MLRFDEVTQNVIRAAMAGMTETVKACADKAEGTTMNLPPHEAAGHPWYGVTARIENEVSFTDAHLEDGVIVAEFGATKRRGDYALMLERMNPYLVPVADQEFPETAARIRKHLEEN